jgi:hypothetical protein
MTGDNSEDLDLLDLKEKQRSSDNRVLKQLGWGGLGTAVLAVWFLDAIVGAPFAVALFVGVLLLCFDAILITMVLAMYRR